MKNLQKSIDKKTLDDLQKAVLEPTDNSLEPTEAEIDQIISLLKEGESYSDIKKLVRRVVEKNGKQESAQGFSFDQIKQIDEARKAKIAELLPEEELV